MFDNINLIRPVYVKCFPCGVLGIGFNKAAHEEPHMQASLWRGTILYLLVSLAQSADGQQDGCFTKSNMILDGL